MSFTPSPYALYFLNSEAQSFETISMISAGVGKLRPAGHFQNIVSTYLVH